MRARTGSLYPVAENFKTKCPVLSTVTVMVTIGFRVYGLGQCPVLIISHFESLYTEDFGKCKVNVMSIFAYS